MNAKPKINSFAVEVILDTALDRLREYDNEFSRLLAVRNGIRALYPFGDARLAVEARKRLSTEASKLGVSDSALAAAIACGIELAKVPRGQGGPLQLAQTTIETLMWGLRDRGFACLEDPGNLDRLRRCDSAAIEQIVKRLMALGWGEDDVTQLAKAWRVLRRPGR
jgi:hypothetical protein